MLGEDFMRCDVCGRVFPLFNNDLILEADKHGMGWHHVCKECLSLRDEQSYEPSYNQSLYSDKLIRKA